MTTSDKGTHSELLVAADLVLKGWHVFRALSPAASCDLVALRKSRIVKVEVRTAASYKGKTYIPGVRGQYDVFAVVGPGATIRYYLQDMY